MEKIHFQRVDTNWTKGFSRIWFLDTYGQSRFLELSGEWTEKEALELLAEIERMFL